MVKSVEDYTNQITDQMIAAFEAHVADGGKTPILEAATILENLIQNYIDESGSVCTFFGVRRHHEDFCKRLLRQLKKGEHYSFQLEEGKEMSPPITQEVKDKQKLLFMIKEINRYVETRGISNGSGAFAHSLAAFRNIFPMYGEKFENVVKKGIPAPKGIFTNFFEFLRKIFVTMPKEKDPKKPYFWVKSVISKIHTPLEPVPDPEIDGLTYSGRIALKLAKAKSIEKDFNINQLGVDVRYRRAIEAELDWFDSANRVTKKEEDDEAQSQEIQMEELPDVLKEEKGFLSTADSGHITIEKTVELEPGDPGLGLGGERVTKFRRVKKT